MNFKKELALRNLKGFTLIELLVVVAIIGIMTTITVGYLSNSRKKGNDAAVKKNLNSLLTSAEVFYVNNSNSYFRPGWGATINYTDNSNDCLVTNESINQMLTDKTYGAFGALITAKGKGQWSNCYNDANIWSVAVGLNMDTTKAWCVDSKPSAKVMTATRGNAIDASTHLCN